MNSFENLCRQVSIIEQSQILKEIEILGFTRVKNYIQEDVIAQLRSKVEDQYRLINSDKKFSYSGVPQRDDEDKILYNVFNIDKLFLDILFTPIVRHVACEKLNDAHYRLLSTGTPNYILGYYNARSSGSKLDLHIDSHIPFQGSRTIMMQFVFLLEDSTEDNGCTIVVPGSHKSGDYTDRNLDRIYPVTGKAGDLIIWDSRLWHGALSNANKSSRWALIATLSSWWIKPSMDIVRSVREEIYKECSDEQKLLLGFCSIPPTDPLQRINTKCDYGFLKPSLADYNL